MYIHIYISVHTPKMSPKNLGHGVVVATTVRLRCCPNHEAALTCMNRTRMPCSVLLYKQEKEL
jgi:hypothetical protein